MEASESRDNRLTSQEWVKQSQQKGNMKELPKCPFCPNEGWIGLGPYLVCSDCLIKWKKKENQKKANEIQKMMED